MRIDVLSKRKKQEIQDFLEQTYEIELPKCQFIQQSKDRIRIFTGNLSEKELGILNNAINLETIGAYFSFSKEKDFRISFDSCFLFKEAKKNVLVLDEEQKQKWLAGEEIPIENTKEFTYPFVLLKYKQDIIGCGKLAQGRVLNFVPKERRIKSMK